jgi:glycosyltransferase involved in cell wall biosynthesis
MGREGRPPRVLHVSEAFGGGVLEMITTLSGRLDAAGYAVAVAYGRRPETPEDVNVRARIAAGVEVFPLGWESRTIAGQLRAWRRLRRLVAAWRPDVVHLHSSFAGLAGALALGADVPTIYTPHGYSFTMGDQSGLGRFAFRTAERLTARRATLVGTVSESEAATARQIAASDKVRVVRNGIPELDGLPADAPFPRRDGKPRAIALGRVTAQHLPEESARLLAAVADLAEVEWVGGGGRGDVPVTVVTDLGVPVSGWVAREEAMARLEGATVLLHWTGWDGQPLSVLEAMAKDVIVIGHDIDAVREILGPEQVRTGEAEGLELLRRTLADPDLRTAMLASQRRRRPAYGATTMAAGWIALYDALLGRAGSADGVDLDADRAGEIAAVNAGETESR